MERIIKVTVKPNQPETKILEEGKDELKVALHAKPIEGEANQELIKFLRKQFNADVEIIRGKTVRKKIIRLIQN